ncbi:MAG: heavy-metal-associated domain-containing protein [Dissulfurispiraceae bacterium]|jgi:copper chaperone
MNELTLKIEGMSCQHCVMRVKKAIDAVRGVSKAEVAIGSAVVSYNESTTSKDEIAAALEKAGYKIVDS